MSLKILIVGSDQVWSLERIYLKHLREEGASVELFAAQNMFYAYNGKSIINKLKLRLGLSEIYRSINDKLRANVSKVRPDIVWVFKGMELLPETLVWMKKKGILLVNYNPDNPFIFSGRGSGNKNITESIPLYDLHFTYNLEVKKRLHTEFRCATAFLPFGFELAEDTFLSAAAEPEILRACFLGNPDEQRAAVIKDLARAGISVDLFGNDWAKFVDPGSLLKTFPAVYGNDFWKILRCYRVQLNLMRVHNENSHNMRSFEVPGVGGIMVAPATTEHNMFFRDGEEAFLFSSVNDCAQKIEHLLSLDKKDADEIRYRARKRSLDDGYTYRQRVKAAFEELKDLYAQVGHPSF